MKLVHLSDTHTYHDQVTISEDADVIIHSGDIGGRTTLAELNKFLIWFEALPAPKKIFIGGNHDHILSKEPYIRAKASGNTFGWLKGQEDYQAARELIDKFDVKYLENKEYVYEGVKFYGSPASPSFHRDNWVFNYDRGTEIKKQWAKIPSDVNVLITHTPPYGVLDEIPENYKLTPDEDVHRGCEDLMDVIRKRLFDLKVHMFGHIHGNTGVVLQPVSHKRNILFSNGAVLNNDYKIVMPQPFVINI
jgi:Icc-related predicted phosphoesterase